MNHLAQIRKIRGFYNIEQTFLRPAFPGQDPFKGQLFQMQQQYQLQPRRQRSNQKYPETNYFPTASHQQVYKHQHPSTAETSPVKPTVFGCCFGRESERTIHSSGQTLFKETNNKSEMNETGLNSDIPTKMAQVEAFRPLHQALRKTV